MNRAALARNQLTLRVIPPCIGCGRFPIPANYDEALSGIQRLRGRRYFADGAIPPAALDAQGRHVTAEDEQSYHLALWNGEVQGCLRVRLYPRPSRPLTEFRVYDLIRRMPDELAKHYNAGMDEFINAYRARGFEPGESGGWAINPKYQNDPAMLALPLAGWSFSRIHSRLIWVAAAAERNGSTKILKRLCGWRLKLAGQELPPFYDAAYKCQMELLCFDSDIINPRFEPAVREFQMLLEEKCVGLPELRHQEG